MALPFDGIPAPFFHSETWGLTGALEYGPEVAYLLDDLTARLVDARNCRIPGGPRKRVICPFTAVTWVQIPSGTPNSTLSAIAVYNLLMMSARNNAPKAGDKCPFCKEGVLGVSPSGQYLICPRCGRVIVPGKPKSTV
jgi:hypothetical protein